LGRYYIVDLYHNLVVDTYVDIEQLGREIGVLAEWESLHE
jgi:hypothetical protein